MTEKRALQRLGDDVRRELERFGASGAMAEIVAVWPMAAGAAVAANAWPARISRDGTLHVTTSSSVWAFELAHLQEALLAKLAAALGDAAPAKLRFAVGAMPSGGAAGAPVAHADAPVPSVEDLRRAEELTGEIANEELRELVARAAAASFARGGSDRSF